MLSNSQDAKIQAILERARHDLEFRNLFLARPLEALAEYDLTQEQMLNFILPNFSWVIEGKLAGMARPNTEEALKALKSQEVTAFLSLTEEPLPLSLLGKYQLQAEHLPIPDFTAPDIQQVEQATQIINKFLEEGLKVGVHCGAGLGRTGTILACYLVREGASASDAVTQIRTKRPGSIETPEQETIIRQYDAHLLQQKPLY